MIANKFNLNRGNFLYNSLLQCGKTCHVYTFFTFYIPLFSIIIIYKRLHVYFQVSLSVLIK